MKNFLELRHHSKETLENILDKAQHFKVNRFGNGDLLKSKTVALLFEKPSNRTRVSFEVGIRELGASPIYLGPESIHMGQRESIEDVARVLSGYVHAVVLRTFDHKNILKFSESATVPVINGLTDLFHPCQIMADIMTVREFSSGDLEKVKIVYVGRGNNILNSWLYASAILGFDFVYSTPPNFRPKDDIVKDAESCAEKGEGRLRFSYSEDPRKAVCGADIVYTDVWISMGQKENRDEVWDCFRSYQVNEELLSLAKDSVKVMHCLPAQRGQEVSETVLESDSSIVFQEAENRLHIQKAIMACLFLS